MSKLLTAFVLHALVALALVPHVAHATNKYPIVLVHGLGGWGRGELLGVPYFGTIQGDFQEKLKQDGYQVFTVGIGKLSSNWDRACELYAQIKGGTVDYGLNHSMIHGHARFGRTYPGLYPQWGTVVNGTLQKVHLMGHSMGGETIRMITQMLNQGVKDALTVDSPTTHPLFAGDKDWVHSVTTLSTPNRGSTLADLLANSIDLIEATLAITFAIAGLTGDTTASVYDPHLDQWGIKPKQKGENLNAYIRRITTSKLFAPGYLDNAGFSLSTGGSTAENSWVKTLPNVYYYSFVTDTTFPSRDLLLRKIALPNTLITSPVITPLATLIGGRLVSKLGFPDEWLPNDGLVSVVSQISDGVSKVLEFTGRSERGAWVRFKTIRADHAGLIGANPLIPVYGLYQAHAALLTDLPSHESLFSKRLHGGEETVDVETDDAATNAVSGVHDTSTAIRQAVFAAQDPIAA